MPDVNEPQGERYDHALAAAVLVLNTLDSSPGASKAELLSCTVFIILEAMNQYDLSRAAWAVATSDN